MATVSTAFPLAGWVAPTVAVIAGAGIGLLYHLFFRKEIEVTDQKSGKKSPVVGLDVNNGGGGVGMDIQSTGQPGAPSVGLEHIVHAQPGQDVVGMRVTQTGQGTGVRVVQNGPGIGMRVGIVIGDKKDGNKG
jgi:hypothetical protein